MTHERQSANARVHGVKLGLNQLNQQIKLQIVRFTGKLKFYPRAYSSSKSTVISLLRRYYKTYSFTSIILQLKVMDLQKAVVFSYLRPSLFGIYLALLSCLTNDIVVYKV